MFFQTSLACKLDSVINKDFFKKIWAFLDHFYSNYEFMKISEYLKNKSFLEISPNYFEPNVFSNLVSVLA